MKYALTLCVATGFQNAERLRKNVSASIKNSQTICSKDVQNICLGEGKYASGDIKAVTGWTANYERKQYKHFEEVSVNDMVDAVSYSNGVIKKSKYVHSPDFNLILTGFIWVRRHS